MQQFNARRNRGDDYIAHSLFLVNRIFRQLSQSVSIVSKSSCNTSDSEDRKIHPCVALKGMSGNRQLNLQPFHRIVML